MSTYLFRNTGSTPTVGSSRIKSSGLCNSETANDTLLCCPPLKYMSNGEKFPCNVYLTTNFVIWKQLSYFLLTYLSLQIRVVFSGSSSRFVKKSVWSSTSCDLIPCIRPKYWNVSLIVKTVNSASSYKMIGI